MTKLDPNALPPPCISSKIPILYLAALPRNFSHSIFYIIYTNTTVDMETLGAIASGITVLIFCFLIINTIYLKGEPF